MLKVSDSVAGSGSFQRPQGSFDFNIEFESICRSLRQRLQHFTSEHACGRWNAALIEDLSSDDGFMATVEKLHIEAAQQCGQSSIVSDGVSIVSVCIEFGVSLIVDFRLDSLGGRQGACDGGPTGRYASAPSRFSVVLAADRNDSAEASFGLGLREPDGDFWYPADDRRTVQAMSPDFDRWAFVCSRSVGRATLASRIRTRS